MTEINLSAEHKTLIDFINIAYSVDQNLSTINLNPEKLNQILDILDDHYFNDQPLVPDAVYDALKRLAGTSRDSIVGSAVRGGKIDLPYPMGSLNQIYDGDFAKWIEKYNLKSQTVVVTGKLDGISCLLIYTNGHLTIAYSRGDGLQGADITRHVKKLSNVPLFINNAPSHLAIRAEIIMKNETFLKYADEYKNARNFVAGCMNRKETEDSILKDIDLVAYEIVDIKPYEYLKKLDMLFRLETYGFSIPTKNIICITDATSETELKNLLETYKKISEYELDGIVITVNDYDSLENKSSADTLNPEHSVKFKVQQLDQIVNATVEDVLWEVSKSGFLKPRVKIKPVELFGTTVTYATGFNAKYIKDSGIGPGAVVSITKSGSVIPYILRTVTPAEPKMPDEIFVWNESGVEAMVVSNNKEVLFKTVLHFFQSLGVDQLKEANLRKIFNDFNLDELDIFESYIYEIMDLTEIEWKRSLGVNGSKVYQSLVNKVGSASIAQCIGPTPFFGIGVGVRKIEMLIEQLDTADDLWYLMPSRLAGLHGFDEKTANKISDGLSRAKIFYDHLVRNYGWGTNQTQNKSIKTSNNLEGMVAIFTGFRDEDLKQRIVSKGGKVVNSMSKKVTCVVCADINSNSNKITTGRSIGAEIIQVNEFYIKYIEDDTPPF
jgi:NAD-dependent DNA ligase